MIRDREYVEGKIVIDREIAGRYESSGIGAILAYIVPEIERTVEETDCTPRKFTLTHGAYLGRGRLSVNMLPQDSISSKGCRELVDEVIKKHPEWHGYISVEEKGKRPKSHIGWT